MKFTNSQIKTLFRDIDLRDFLLMPNSSIKAVAAKNGGGFGKKALYRVDTLKVLALKHGLPASGNPLRARHLNDGVLH